MNGRRRRTEEIMKMLAELPRWDRLEVYLYIIALWLWRKMFPRKHVNK